MSDTDTASASFDTLGLNPELLRAVSDLGYEEPTEIQVGAIPPLLEGRDLLGRAATGTGKTAAFALPLLQRLDIRGKGPQVLVLAPTRELAMQTARAVHRYGKHLDVSVLPVYGGAPMNQQIRALHRGVHVVVGTPGRVLDHLNRGTLTLKHLTMVVLDEADEMLNMGFQEELEAILAEVPDERQMALFSATYSPEMRDIAERMLRDPVTVEVERDRPSEGEMPRVRQAIYLVGRNHKQNALARVLDMEDPDAALVFCRTRIEVEELAEVLSGRGYRAEALHGGLTQQRRERVLQRLRNKTADLVVATDVAARGIDIGHLSHVVNFGLPSSPEQYVHRIGRTGRAGREGVAITLAEPRERRLLRRIERLLRQRIPIEAVPTVADLRARQLDLVRTQVVEVAATGDLERYRELASAMMEDLDVLDVAAAALKALHETQGGVDDQEIPDMGVRQERPSRRDDSRGGDYRRGGDSRGEYRRSGGDSRQGHPRDNNREWTRLFIGLGRINGVRPGDLFGAIANEAQLQRGRIGNIELTDKFSIVEVHPQDAERVITVLRRLTWNGRRVFVKLDRFQR